MCKTVPGTWRREEGWGGEGQQCLSILPPIPDMITVELTLIRGRQATARDIRLAKLGGNEVHDAMITVFLVIHCSNKGTQEMTPPHA